MPIAAVDIKRSYIVQEVKLICIFFLFLINGCGQNTDEPKTDARWYTQSQVDSGRSVFKANCAACHGENGQSTENWRQRMEDGSYPPPPLNGTAHTWHHALAQLKRTIDGGGILVGGKMPPFKDQLSEDDKDAVIAFIQSQWSDEIYTAWLKMGGLK